MIIIQINTVPTSGSTGKIVAQLYDTIINKGGECFIAYGRSTPAPGYKTVKIGNRLSIAWHGICTRLFDLHGRCSVLATRKFLKELDKISPDVIHIHSLHGYYINYSLLFEYIKNRNIPVVWTMHDCWALTGHCPHFYYAKCEKWRTQCHNCQLKLHHPKSIFLDNSKSNHILKKQSFCGVSNMLIVTPSNWLKDIIDQSFLCHYNTICIHNGLDTNLFCPGESDIRKKYNISARYIILGVANIWSEEKGLKYLVDMQHFINDSDIQIIIVGLSKKQIKKIDNKIIAVTRTDSIEELINLYRGADVFVNPTLEDNFPTTNLEALACGTPVVTFNTGGSPEAIDSTCGIVCREKTTAELVASCREALFSASFSRDDCRKRALEFNSKYMYEKYWEKYLEITNYRT